MRCIGKVCLVCGALMVSVACVPPQRLLRHVAEWRFGPEQLTTVTAAPDGGGGTVIYNKTFPLPSSEKTLFVTLSSTGDGHGGAALWFAALVNEVPCNRGDEGAGFAPTGWVPLLKNHDSSPGGDGGGGIGDLHDNGIYYTWCCREGLRPGGPNNVQIKLASSITGQFVFVERSHYYIDSDAVAQCTEAERAALDREGLAAAAGQQNPHEKHDH